MAPDEPTGTGSPATRPSLLLRIRDHADNVAWQEFVELYAPLVYQHARRWGLQDADAADIAQEVMRAVATAMPTLNFDPRRGSFRGWLFTIVRNAQRNWYTREKRRPALTGQQALLEEQPDKTAEQQSHWDLEYEKRLFSWASTRVRAQVKESTWRAFWQTAVEGKTFRQAAEALELSLGAVYVAKCRVLDRIRAEIKRLEEL